MDNVVLTHFRTRFYLVDAFPPTERQMVFMPRSGYQSTLCTTTRLEAPAPGLRPGSPQPSGASTPRYDRGMLDPLSPASSTFRPPSGYFAPSQATSSDLAEETFGASSAGPSRNQNHWILNEKLLDKVIRVDIKGGQYDSFKRNVTRYVRVVESAGGGCMLNLVSQAKIPVPIPASTVFKHRNRPKPRTEKSLMVVIGGCEQDIGKYVRQINYFWKGSKAEENLRFVLQVVAFDDEVEYLVDEPFLRASPDDVEYVYESDETRRAGNKMLQDICRDSKTFGGQPVVP